MYKFIFDDGDEGRSVCYECDEVTWPKLVEHFNYFLAGCGFIAHYPFDEHPFCDPKNDRKTKSPDVYPVQNPE